MINAPEGTALYYRQLAEYVRSRTFRDAAGNPDDARLDRHRLRHVQSALIAAKHKRTAKEMRAAVEMALAVICVDDEELIKILKADDAESVARYEARAAEIEAQQVGERADDGAVMP